MTTVKAMEYHIIRDVMRRRAGGRVATRSRLVERLITTAATTAVLLLLASCLQELLWGLLGAGAVLVLGTRKA